MHRKIWAFRIGVVCMIIGIFILSNQQGNRSAALADYMAHVLSIGRPDSVSPSTDPIFAGLNLRNYAHVMLYFILGIFVFWSLKDGKRPWTRLFMALGICCVCGCLDEIHQMFIPGRTARLFDILIDGIGFGPAVMISFGIRRLIKGDKG